MRYTAKQLFPDWYREAVKKEVSIEELDNRRKGIEGIIAKNERDFWTMLLIVYLGFDNINEETLAELVNFFKKEDDYFSTKNDNLLRTLLGCAIAEKIELNNSWVSDYCTVAILIHSSASNQQLPALSELAFRSWVTECERYRNIEMPTKNIEYKPIFNKLELSTWAADTVIDASSMKNLADKIIESFNATIKEFNNLSIGFGDLKNERDAMVNGITALSEECDILWWLFGGNSVILNRALKDVPDEIYGLILALELERMTKNIPGIGKIDNLLRRATEMKPELQSKAYSLNEICKTLCNASSQFPKTIQNSLKGKFMEIGPLLNVLKISLENTFEDSVNILNKKPIISLEKKYSPTEFASQLYKELMLSRLYNEISE